MPTPVHNTAHAREAVLDRARSAETISELFEAVSARLRRLVPFDAAVWLGSDPATGVPAAPTVSENMLGRTRLDLQYCLRVWESEFLDHDVNSFSDLTRAEVPAGGLRIATRDRPARSSRYREVLREKGFGDELRAVLRLDGHPWALVGLFREQGRPAFASNEIELVSGLSRPLAETLRDHIRPPQQPIADVGVPGPGLMLFAASGELVSVNDDALAWLGDLPEGLGEQPAIGSRLPIFVVATLMKARAVAEELESGPARVRIRSRTGRWLVCHASCLRDADGRLGHTALVIEPASSSEIAPIIVRAYDLSTREQQITKLIAHGHDTAAIAFQLHLSAHTVRGYIKAIFEKVGVRSRGELVTKLFAEHYATAHLDPSNHTISRQ
jgi:DNA-binding CsgD family transcriptional regulator